MTENDLQPLSPSKAKRMYLQERKGEVTERTHQAHDYRLVHFIAWCADEGIDNLNDLTGRDIHEFRLWRKADGDLNAVSLRTQLQTLRVFIRFCESIDGVRDELSDKVRLPEVSPDDERSRAILVAERAEKILEYLSKFEYASREHAILALLWHTGMRMGAAHSLDVTDFDREGASLELAHRPETETTLKNRERGERLVGLTLKVRDVIADWIDHNRPDVEDEHGRKPLLATRHGRLSQSAMRETLYRVTRPCYYFGVCPHDRDPDECPGTEQGRMSKCPSSVSPHAVRRGSITHHLTNDVPEQVVSDRMNVSGDVLDKHYDERDEETKMEQRRGYLDNL